MTEDFKAMIQESLSASMAQAKSIGVAFFNSFYFERSGNIVIDFEYHENKRKNAVFSINDLSFKGANDFTPQEMRLISEILSVYFKYFYYHAPHYLTCYFAKSCVVLNNEYWFEDSYDPIDICQFEMEEIICD